MTKGKRYSFRLNGDDKAIADFINQSEESNSETIRKLLVFAIEQIEKEKAAQKKRAFHSEIMDELGELRKQQIAYHKEVINKLEKGVVVDKTKEKIDQMDGQTTKSVENSIDSMLKSFGMDNL